MQISKFSLRISFPYSSQPNRMVVLSAANYHNGAGPVLSLSVKHLGRRGLHLQLTSFLFFLREI